MRSKLLTFGLGAVVASLIVLAPAGPGRGQSTTESTGSGRFFSWLLGIDLGGSGVLGGENRGWGELWVAPLDGGPPARVGAGREYSRPVFTPDGARLLALDRSGLVTVSLASGAQEILVEDDKLIAPVAMNEKGEVLAARNDGGSAVPVTVTNGTIAPLTGFDPKEWDRVFRGVMRSRKDYSGLVAVDTVAAQAQVGAEIHVYRDGAGRPVTACAPARCIQPALDPAGTRVAFIRLVP